MAEFLVKADGHWMDNLTQAQVNSLMAEQQIDYNARHQKGDIIAVRPNGWAWGNKECLPHFVVVKVPDMTLATAQQYEGQLMSPVVLRTQIFNPAMLSTVATMDTTKAYLVRASKSSLPVSFISASVTGNIATTAAMVTPLVVNKIGATSEVLPPVATPITPPTT